MENQVLSVRLPRKLVQAIDQLAIGDGLNKAAPRSEVIRDLLAKVVRSERRKLSR
ncbi:ribbon-helix-helix protein, CopG family [Methylobacterium sp. C25]|uniref:ribbon-helix-helix protein, CopG family n=1 Tax=Methylobacterium sp. C25 TaxID=2721622 RepID=UPI003FA37AA9|nr:ribbon-helix-helix protein, CopG family [Methylobacterium sp. C25]